MCDLLHFQNCITVLFFLAITRAIVTESVIVEGQHLDNGIDENVGLKSSTKVNFDNENDNKPGIIILAALRRRGGRRQRKYKKVVQETKTETPEPLPDPTPHTTRPPKVLKDEKKKALSTISRRITRPTKSVPHKKPIKVNVEDLEEYSLRRARYLFTLRSGK